MIIRSSTYNASFLQRILSSPQAIYAIEEASVGTTMVNLNQATLANLPLVCPAPQEQRAIAKALSDVDALLSVLDRLIAKKRDLKQAAMQQLLTGKTRLPGFDNELVKSKIGDPRGWASGEDGVHVEVKPGYKLTEVGVIPNDWEVLPFEKVLSISSGQVDPKIAPYSSMVLVAPDHVASSTGQLLRKESAEDQSAISGKYIFNSGDIVYSKIRPYLRKVILADFSGLCSADMYPLHPAENVEAGFALALLLGHRFSAYVDSVSIRSGMPKINRSELSEYFFAVPKVSEQLKIARVLQEMDSEITALESRRQKTHQLKQGMMQELLTGKTRLVKPEVCDA